MKYTKKEVKELLDSKYLEFNQPDYIKDDPIQIPHRFTRKEDIEIAGFFASLLAWGLRKTIINKCNNLIERMDNAPYDFILNHSEKDLKNLIDFKHRTFNDTDALYFVASLNNIYKNHGGLETVFASGITKNCDTVEKGLINFRNIFFELEDSPKRTEKHVSSPIKKSACKRLNMYLRWMVRKDDKGVDFGIWKSIPMSHLLIPLDVHVDRVGRKLGLIKRKQTDWMTLMEIHQQLKKMDRNDPAKYDFALFGLGLEKFAH